MDLMRAVWATLDGASNGEKPRGNDEDGPNSYVALTRAASLAEILDELDFVVGELSGARDLRDIRRLLKSYHIGWVTLSDVLAKLINDALDLRLPDKGVSWRQLLGKPRVAQSRLAEIYQHCSSSLLADEYKSVRNETVHCGNLQDAELDDLERRRFSIVLEALDPSSHSLDVGQAEAAADADPRVLTSLAAFTEARTAVLKEHLRVTKIFVNEVDHELARVIREAQWLAGANSPP